MVFALATACMFTSWFAQFRFPKGLWYAGREIRRCLSASIKRSRGCSVTSSGSSGPLRSSALPSPFTLYSSLSCIAFMMRSAFLSTLSFFLVATRSVRAATYSLSSDIVGHDFLDEFTWEAISDPTHGRVLVVNFSTIKH